MAKLPEGAKIISTPAPENARVIEPINEAGSFVPEPFTPNAETPGAGINPIAGNFEALGSGVTLGGSDELMAAMAAATAKFLPLFDEDFVQDKTIAQLYADAVKDFRKRKRQFREQEGAVAYVPEVIGGLMSGGTGISRLAPAAHPYIGGAAIGGAEGVVAGALSADADEFLSLDTVMSSLIGGTIGAASGFAFPVVQSLAMQGARALPKAVKSLFTTKSTLKQKYIAQLESGDGLDDDMAKYIIDGAGKLKTNKLLPEAITQGWHPGTVNMVAGAKPADKTAFIKMIDIIKRGRTNRAFQKANHPRKIMGDTFLKRVNFLKSENKKASQAIGDIAEKKLRGAKVDLRDATDGFERSLAENGIEHGFNEKGKLIINFDNSGLTPKDRAPVKEVIRQWYRISEGGIDGAKAHELKKVIDDNVTWGKADSMSHSAASMLKNYRRAIDDKLDTSFPDYAAANEKYRDTIEVLESFVNDIGKKIDLEGDRAGQAVGRELRKVLGNTKVAESLADTIDQAEKIAAKYGADFDDSAIAQLHFLDDLSERLGPFEQTSFRAEVGRGNVDAARRTGQMLTGDRTATGVLLDFGEEIANSAKNISDDGAIEVIEKLINQTGK